MRAGRLEGQGTALLISPPKLNRATQETGLAWNSHIARSPHHCSHKLFMVLESDDLFDSGASRPQELVKLQNPHGEASCFWFTALFLVIFSLMESSWHHCAGERHRPGKARSPPHRSLLSPSPTRLSPSSSAPRPAWQWVSPWAPCLSAGRTPVHASIVRRGKTSHLTLRRNWGHENLLLVLKLFLLP